LLQLPARFAHQSKSGATHEWSDAYSKMPVPPSSDRFGFKLSFRNGPIPPRSPSKAGWRPLSRAPIMGGPGGPPGRWNDEGEEDLRFDHWQVTRAAICINCVKRYSSMCDPISDEYLTALKHNRECTERESIDFEEDLIEWPEQHHHFRVLEFNNMLIAPGRAG